MNDISYSDMRSMLKSCLYEVRLDTTMAEAARISTGFNSLDELIGGFEKGKVYVIGGRPAMGKDTFMLSMIRNIIMESKLPVLLFSTNHRKSDDVFRLLSIHCDIPTSKLRKGRLEAFWEERLDEKAGTLVDAPLFIHDSLDLPLSELTETARHCIKEKEVKIIFIDCLQMIDFDKVDINSSERIAKVMNALKQLAYETDLPVVVGSMLHRDVGRRNGLEGKRPQLTDLQNSCYIEELADVVIMVHRPEYYQILQDEDGRDLRGLMEIIVKKNALKPLGSIMLEYHQETGQLRLPEETEKPVPEPVCLEDFRTDDQTIENLIKTFDLEDGFPF